MNLDAIYFSEGRCTPNGATAFNYDYNVKAAQFLHLARRGVPTPRLADFTRCVVYQTTDTQYRIFFDTVNSAPDKDKEWSKIYLTQEAFLDNIFFEYFDVKEQYFLKERQSWALEFSRSQLYEKLGITRSRLFYDTGYFEGNGGYVHKDEIFIKWAEKLVKKFKKEFLIKFKTPQADFATRDFIKNYTDPIKLSL